jgi:short-subunit dehydrogenase
MPFAIHLKNITMTNLKEKYGKTALVAGSSEGLGEAYCHALADQGIDLIMIARRKDKLDKAAEQVRLKYGVKVIAIAADLADDDIIKTIQDAIGDMLVNILIYDAGMPYIGPFLEAPIDKHISIAKVNMQGPLRLVHHFGAGMVARGKGAVVLMSSIAGFQGAGFLTTYASTKAFNRELGESLWYEWKDKGVDVIACSAGTIATPDYLNTNPEDIGILAPPVQQPEEVVKECLSKLGAGPSFVAGTGNKMATFFMGKLLPRKTAISIMGDTTRKMYRIKY